MRKPTLLYASPLPPARSGIADYSAYLLPALAEFFDVTLYAGNAEPLAASVAGYPVVRHGKDTIAFGKYDYRMYQMGNNPWHHGYIYDAALSHPGWVVLHEFVLYFLVVGLYRDRPEFYSRIYRLGGAPAIAALREMARGGIDSLQFKKPQTLPLNSELLQSGNRILVHSDYTRRLIAEIAPDVRIDRAELAQADHFPAPKTTRAEWLASLALPPDAVVIASFGFVAPTKLNHLACRAIERLVSSRNAPVYYLMAGEGNYVDSYRSDRIRVTGYVTEEEFDGYLAHSDLVLNLRYPVMGETSAALLRAFAFGRPCIVTDAGWFSELPANVVLQLDATSPEIIEEQLFEAISIFLDHPGPFRKMGQQAALYAREYHSASAVARRYFELLTAGE
jgi:glycosyltransferase involved in cell wall biosynthesis